jgi:hypothetical protein
MDNIIDFESLKIELSLREKNKLYLTFDGEINEDFLFNKIPEHSILNKVDEALFDFAKLKSINSCGVREWIKFLNLLNEKFKLQISYLNCSQVFIQQVNMVEGFLASNITVQNFYSPYFCNDCDHEEEILLSSADCIDNDKKAPILKCPKCNGKFELDAIESAYLAFLKG